MISQIGIEEFRTRLKTNTKLGNPTISGSPLHVFNMVGEKDKLFYGILNQNDFKITINAILYPIPYVLKGKFKSKNLNQTEISYEIIPIKFGYYWNRYLPLAGFFFFNTIFIIKKAPLIVWVLCNSFILITSVISYLWMKYKKEKFEKKFIQLFEILAPK